MANNTQKIIFDAFNNMLDHVPFDKITVTALIKECNISRNTFYYHYEDIFALLDDVLTSVLKKYDDATKEYKLQDVLKTLLYDCRENRKKIYNIFNSLSRDRLERYIFNQTNSVITFKVMELAEQRNVDNERADAVANIVRYSIYGFFIQFLWNDMKDDIEESVDSLCKIYNELIDSMLV